MNKKAIFYVINDSYTFAVANQIMSLNHHSPTLMEECDIVIYNTDISGQNKQLLNTLHNHIVYKEMIFPVEWNNIFEHKSVSKWGEFVIGKLFGFDLIHQYEKVIFMDADMHIQGDISELFEIEEEFAWRRILAWDPQKVFADILTQNEVMKAGSAGLYIFTDKLKKYNIDYHHISDAYETVKNINKGIDEQIVAWIIHKNNIQVKELDEKIYNVAPHLMTDETKIIHFTKYKTVQFKPWLNLASYYYFTSWAENYQRWLDLGGDGPVQITNENIYKLFSIEKEKLNFELTKENKKLKQEYKKLEDKYNNIENKYNKIENSKFWKIYTFLKK